MVWLAVAGAVGGVIWLDPLKLAAKKPAVVILVDAPVPLVVADAALVSMPVPVPVDATERAPLYTVTEALDDVASGPLVFTGIGEWFGNYSIKGCAYRNARVIVVNEYCTTKEQPAFGLIVISPTRGYLRIYAEADAAISTLDRSQYATFRVESAPPVTEPIAVDARYAQLRAWDERRYNAHIGGCWSGDAEGCSEGLEPLRAAWLPSTKAFLETSSPQFAGLVKTMHARAVRGR